MRRVGRPMSDCEDTNIVWESWTSPGKRKRKRKKDKKSPKYKNNTEMKTDEKKKKKKNLKFKEAMVERQTKRKEKKKKKNRLALELDDSYICTQASNAQEKPAMKPETLSPRDRDKPKPDHLDQDFKKKKKRKKKVGFDLSQGYIRVKRPKFVSSSPQCPKKIFLSENEAVLDGESCSQVTVTGHSQGLIHEHDSQCNSEDINSQDLFITQKTFRASPSEPSSGEISDKALSATPQMFTQRDEMHMSVMSLTKHHLEGSCKSPEDSNFLQYHRNTNQHKKKPKTVQVCLTDEEEEEERGLNKTHHNNKNGQSFFQTQIELKASLAEVKKVACPVLTKPSEVNPYLASPVDVNSSLDVVKIKKHSCTLSEQSMTSTSTQTENLFTTELCSYLNFCQNNRKTLLFKDLKPLDLSLPERARKDLRMCSTVKTSSLQGQITGDIHQDHDLHSSFSDMNDIKIKKEPSGQHPCFVSTHGKEETILSPQSESEPKSADTTTSGEDCEHPCRTSKLDLTQVKAVQMKLNESFFFKTKGEGLSPRPESPLMKLSQGREVKSRKGH